MHLPNVLKAAIAAAASHASSGTADRGQRRESQLKRPRSGLREMTKERCVHLGLVVHLHTFVTCAQGSVVCFCVLLWVDRVSLQELLLARLVTFCLRWLTWVALLC